MSTHILDNRTAQTGLASGDTIAVILQEEYSPRLEKRAVGCIRDALEDTHLTVQIVPPDKFREVAFPKLVPEEIPPGGASWEQHLDDPTFRQRISPLRLRYLIGVSASELSSDSPVDSAFAAGGGYGGGFFALSLDWKTHHKTWMKATIMDLAQAHVAGTVSAQATGESHKGVILFYLVLPLPYAVPSGGVTSRACGELGEGVAKFLSGEEPSPETEAEQSERAAAKTEDPVPPPGDLRTLDWSSTPCC